MGLKMFRRLANLFSGPPEQVIYGGAKRDPKWDKTRDKFLIGKKCAACGTTQELEAHHILPLYFGGAELDEANLLALCRLHHFVFGHLGSWYSYNPNVIQDCAAYLVKILNRPKRPHSPSIPS
jgi:hypothetical protein